MDRKIGQKQQFKDNIGNNSRKGYPLEHMFSNKKIPINQKKVNQKNEDHKYLLNKVLSIDTTLKFQQCWEKLTREIKQDFLIIGLQLKPKTSKAEQLLREGKFIILLSDILSKNEYTTVQLIKKSLYAKYHSSIIKSILQFNQYFQDVIKSKAEQNLIKLKDNQDNKIVPVKRSPEIIYQTSQNILKRKIQRVKLRFQYILDFFQINDVYLLEQVDVNGIIDQIQGQYIIMLVRKKNTEQQFVAIGIIQQKSTYSQQILKKIEKDHENLSFVDIQGKDINKIWLKSIQ